MKRNIIILSALVFMIFSHHSIVYAQTDSKENEYSALESIPEKLNRSPSIIASPTLTIERNISPITRPSEFRSAHWAFAIEGAYDAFGNHLFFEKKNINGVDKISPRASKMGLKINKLIQVEGAGAFSVGPIFSMYPLRNKGSLKASGPLSLWSSGAELSFQIQPFERQWILPYVTGEYSALRSEVEKSSWSRIFGYGAGLLVNLNLFDENSALQFYGRTGVQRTFFSIEWKAYQSSDVRFSTENGPHLFGSLRVEL